MRLPVIRILAALNISLAAGLLWLWVDTDGQLRHVHWTAPIAQKPDFSNMLPAIAPQSSADVSQFLTTLERPLFSPSRRPPPPVIVVPPPPPPPPDPLNTLHLYGLFEGKDGGGILARVDGKMVRVRIKETVGEWTLKSIKDRDITFAKGVETRIIPLVHARPAPPTPPTPAAAAASAGALPGAAPPGNSGVVGNASANPLNLPINPNKQQIEDYTRERLRMRNEIFRKAGLPPVTQ